MDAVLRSASIYFFLLLVFRLAGKRTLAEVTPFELILLLIIGEATQQALLGDDVSVTNGMLVITTLVVIDIALGLLKQRAPRLERVVEGTPVVIFADGELLRERMREARLDESDILEAARVSQGLESLDQVKFAVLERSGGISIIPR